jgi:hypothetical protein
LKCDYAGSEETKEKSEDLDLPNSSYPRAVMDYIERDNTSFEDWIQEIIITQDATVFNQREKQKLVQSLYTDLHCTSLGNAVFTNPNMCWGCIFLAEVLFLSFFLSLFVIRFLKKN